MKNLTVNSDPRVAAKFKSYPIDVRKKLDFLRKLILEVAAANNSIHEIEETLKWGEPSYLTKKGSTLRMDWKDKNPDQYAMYFKCTSKLVPTFREVFGDTFSYEKNRAIIFSLDDKIPEKKLKACIAMALSYHSIKHLPRLGH